MQSTLRYDWRPDIILEAKAALEKQRHIAHFEVGQKEWRGGNRSRIRKKLQNYNKTTRNYP